MWWFWLRTEFSVHLKEMQWRHITSSPSTIQVSKHSSMKQQITHASSNLMYCIQCSCRGLLCTGKSKCRLKRCFSNLFPSLFLFPQMRTNSPSISSILYPWVRILQEIEEIGLRTMTAQGKTPILEPQNTGVDNCRWSGIAEVGILSKNTSLE